MLRITHTQTVLVTTIGLEGKLLSPWVDEVRSAVAAVRGGGAIWLNLENLQFVDTAGAELLRDLQNRGGVRLMAASPFVDALLAAV